MHTLRIGSFMVSAVFAWVLAAWFAVDLLIKGTLTDYWTYLPWLAFASWLVWLVFVRPRVQVYPDRAVSRELLRDYELPYEQISDIIVGRGVRFQYTDAAGKQRRLECWNAPGLLKLRRLGDKSAPWGQPTMSRETAQAMNEHPRGLKDLPARVEPTGALTTQWSRYEHEGAPREVTIRWAVWPWAVAAVLLVLGMV